MCGPTADPTVNVWVMACVYHDLRSLFANADQEVIGMEDMTCDPVTMAVIISEAADYQNSA